MFLLAQLPAETLRAQLSNGVILMVLGMAIVFVFLTILVFTTKAVSKIVGKFESKKPQKAPAAPVVAAPAAVSSIGVADAEVAAAIVAAVAKSQN